MTEPRAGTDADGDNVQAQIDALHVLIAKLYLLILKQREVSLEMSLSLNKVAAAALKKQPQPTAQDFPKLMELEKEFADLANGIRDQIWGAE